MNQYVAFVKRQIAYYQNQVERFPSSHRRHRTDLIEMYERLVREHQELLAYLESIQSTADSIVSVAPKAAPPDLSDLPPELLAELSDAVTKGETDPVVSVINARGGTATLDEIIIDLYRYHGEVSKRTLLANRLYRLAKRGLVTIAPGKKGIYSTKTESTPDLFEGNIAA